MVYSTSYTKTKPQTIVSGIPLVLRSPGLRANSVMQLSRLLVESSTALSLPSTTSLCKAPQRPPAHKASAFWCLKAKRSGEFQKPWFLWDPYLCIYYVPHTLYLVAPTVSLAVCRSCLCEVAISSGSWPELQLSIAVIQFTGAALTTFLNSLIPGA